MLKWELCRELRDRLLVARLKHKPETDPDFFKKIPDEKIFERFAKCFLCMQTHVSQDVIDKHIKYIANVQEYYDYVESFCSILGSPLEISDIARFMSQEMIDDLVAWGRDRS